MDSSWPVCGKRVHNFVSDRVRASCPESPRSKKRGKSETECLALPINGAKMGSFLAGLDQYLRLVAVVGGRAVEELHMVCNFQVRGRALPQNLVVGQSE